MGRSGNSAFRWSTLDCGGHAVDVLEPACDPVGGLLWLHDWDCEPLRGRTACEEALARSGLVVACPAGGQTAWIDVVWPPFDSAVSPMEFLRTHLTAALQSNWNLPAGRIALAGIGMGGQGAINLAFRYARQFPVVAALAPDIDFHQWYGHGLPLDRMFPSAEAARQQTAILHLHPLNWPRQMFIACDPADTMCFDGAERLAGKLSSSGIPFECDFLTSTRGDHRTYLTTQIPRIAAFLAESLRKVSHLDPV
jgi:S-formylglutathione hydrolase FrmB